MSLSRIILALVSWYILLLPQVSNATHVSGLEMFYRWKSDSTYEITVVHLRDCQGTLRRQDRGPLPALQEERWGGLVQDFPAKNRQARGG